MVMQNKSHLTAITRNKPSSPTRYLIGKDLLQGNILDFGCGKGFDVSYLREKGFEITGYDPYFFPNKPSGLYDTIICHYVINVLEKEKESEVLNEISNYLKENGTAFITVRRDIKNEVHTSKGTYQRNVTIDLPVIKENSNYCIYKLKKKK